MGLINVALSGKAGAGKTTVANYLVQQRGYARVSFAEPLKLAIGKFVAPMVYRDRCRREQCSNFPHGEAICPDCPIYEMPLAPMELVAWVNRNKDTLRPLLQACGTALREIVSPDYWVDQALVSVAKFNAAGFAVVIDDVRYRNEAEALFRADFSLIRLVRTQQHYAANNSPVLDGDRANHASETDLDHYPMDLIVENNGTAENLCNAVARALDLGVI